jgi:enterochelin esterase-like enzyme
MMGAVSRPRTLMLSFESRPRRVRVVVPKGVEEMPPVLVLFDGQNVLGDRGSFSGGWRAHEAIERLPGTIRRPVLIAVDHGEHHRIRELWDALDPLLAFVIEQVLPHAETCAGRSFDPTSSVIGGASMGGLASLAALARHPHRFRGALAMSPSAWLAPGSISRELRHAKLAGGARAYVDVGHRESEGMVHHAAAVSQVLEARLGPEQVMWRPDRRGQHRERDWRRRLPKALRFLFRR